MPQVAYLKTYFGQKLSENGDFENNGRTDWCIILKTDFEVENDLLPRSNRVSPPIKHL